MSPLRELARERKEAVILFDDLTRATKAAEIIPFVLEELAAGGIADNKIRFIAALGSHGAMNRTQFVKKLGKEVVDHFPVYNHNAFSSSIYIGTTSHGIKVYINSEVMKCDLKIGISSVVPHPQAGFGGGPKIILPGVSSIETIIDNHNNLEVPSDKANGEYHIMGMENSPWYLDFKEAAAMAGLDMSIDCLENSCGEIVSIFSGSLEQAFNLAVKEAKIHYLTNRAKNKDIVILNTFVKASAAIDTPLMGYNCINKKGGDIVLVANAPEGQVIHFAGGVFGKSTGARMWLRMKLPSHINRLIIYSEYPDHTIKGYFEESDKIVLTDNWEEVIHMLQKFHSHDPEIAVYPSADIQIFRK